MRMIFGLDLWSPISSFWLFILRLIGLHFDWAVPLQSVMQSPPCPLQSWVFMRFMMQISCDDKPSLREFIALLGFVLTLN